MGSSDYYGKLLAYGEFVSDVDVCERSATDGLYFGLSGAGVDFGGGTFTAFLEEAEKSSQPFEVSIFWRGRVWRCDVAPSLSFNLFRFADVQERLNASGPGDKGASGV